MAEQKQNAIDDKIIRKRMLREGCNSGELHASLIWNDIADLDLHVITPLGEHMYFGHKESKCGGWLDRDMNAAGNPSLEPIENIFWASSPSGKYKFYVNNYNNRTDPNTVFVDPDRKVPFRVKIKRQDKVEWFSGEAGPREDVTCFEFDHIGSGAMGPYIVLPKNDDKTTFKDLCTKHKVTYSQGEGYYGLSKKEKISTKKNMVLYNTVNDTFIIGPDACKTDLGLALNVELNIGPKDIKKDHVLFIQSTSHNRVIPKNTLNLMKVPMKEALVFRRGDDYKF